MRKIFTLSLMALFLFTIPASAIIAATDIKIMPISYDESEKPNIVDIQDHWAKEEIVASFEKEFMKGISVDEDGLVTFAPDQKVTKAQLAVLITRVFDLDTITSSDEININMDSWYSEAIELCLDNEIFDSSKNFKPDAYATRIEVAQAISNAFKAADINVPTTQVWFNYSDIDNLDEADVLIVQFMANSGIMKGYNQEFRPHDTISRAEIAAIVNRTDKIVQTNTELKIPSKVSLEIPEKSEELLKWIEENKNVEGIYSTQYNNQDVYLIAMGEKPTGGYEVVIDNIVVKNDNHHIIEASYKSPRPNTPVTTAITYPYQLIAVPAGTPVVIDISQINNKNDYDKPQPDQKELIGKEKMPKQVIEWAEQKKDDKGIHKKQFKSYDVYMIARGEKPTGGYEVIISNSEFNEDGKFLVDVEYKSPAPDEAVIMILTYPYELFAVPSGTDVKVTKISEA
ncbi:hypothetical protein SYNTR_0078 [Candidatus Syntrophocurvum alkaliphilum]|uniref:SLH domain-containing protein n=1 Tax=Candidatus Syntrophocurvum alkaliphilum TaxID=2293317 RepID=A0A6I6DDL0_9FIRM|nr:protease complex subunit PrcB family protein [Candidatus Syntrophocurvum alkaliphilum]QGT98671.1 hypothetical protein SYNTR_0078 [Candidatus Syntrophocurvum alkaliphilum]